MSNTTIETVNTPKPNFDFNTLLQALKYRYATKKFDGTKDIPKDRPKDVIKDRPKEFVKDMAKDPIYDPGPKTIFEPPADPKGAFEPPFQPGGIGMPGVSCARPRRMQR